jgi:hypothetical protein
MGPSAAELTCPLKAIGACLRRNEFQRNRHRGGAQGEQEISRLHQRLLGRQPVA